MTRRQFRTWCAASSLSLVLALLNGCGVPTGNYLSIGTGSTGGSFFPLGTGMATVANDHLGNVQVNAESTGGSLDNMKLLRNAEIDFALSDIGVAYNEYRSGTNSLRGVAIGFTQPMHILTASDSGIHTVSGLRGKRVAIGPAGSGTSNMAEQMFRALGVWEDIDTLYLEHTQESQELSDGRIDAAMYVVGIPASSVDTFLNSSDGRFVTFSPDDIRRINEANPSLVAATIPAGSYQGQGEEVPTVGVPVGLVTDVRVPNQTVHAVTRAITENPDVLADYHPTGATFDVDGALEGMQIPVHEGAAAYYAEAGYPKPGDG